MSGAVDRIKKSRIEECFDGRQIKMIVDRIKMFSWKQERLDNGRACGRTIGNNAKVSIGG